MTASNEGECAWCGEHAPAENLDLVSRELFCGPPCKHRMEGYRACARDMRADMTAAAVTIERVGKRLRMMGRI